MPPVLLVDFYFHIQWFIPYLNFHRPCAYAQTTVDHKGKKKKKYKDYDTPYERLKALDEPDQYLRRNFSFALLDSTAYNESDTSFAKKMKDAKQLCFQSLSLL